MRAIISCNTLAIRALSCDSECLAEGKERAANVSPLPHAMPLGEDTHRGYYLSCSFNITYRCNAAIFLIS